MKATLVPILLAGVTVAALVPFLDKAFHVDDPLFVWCAKWIVGHPADPYGFTVVWYFDPAPMAQVMRNPPLHCYYLAAAGAALGFSERALHTAMLVPAVACVLGAYALAGGLSRRPWLAGLLVLASPGFFVSATGVMCDVTMLALSLWAAVAWTSGIESGRKGRLIAAAFLLAAAGLAKFNGLLLLPALFLHGLAAKRPLRSFAPFLAIPAVALGAYLAAASALYGGSLSLALSKAAGGPTGPPAGTLLLTLLVFAGGAALPALFGAPAAFSRRGAVLFGAAFALTLGAAALGLADGLLPAPRAPARAVALQGAVLLFAGIAAARLCWPGRALRASPPAVLLASWALLSILFTAFASWSVGARYLLPVVPAAAVLLARALDGLDLDRAKQRAWHRLAPVPILVLAGAVAAVVAVAERDHANSARDAAAQIVGAAPPGARVWFLGHWGFQHYMESLGARALPISGGETRPGDRAVYPVNNTNTFALPRDQFPLSSILDLPGPRFATTMHPEVGAGFYSSMIGPLPFAFGRVPPERYWVLRVAR